MNKILRFSIPFLASSLMLGMIFYLAGASNRAAAALSPFTPEGAILVTTLEDELNSDGDCSLREAVEAANDNIAVDACSIGDAVITDTITFDVAGIITFTSQLSVTAGGPLVIDGGEVITTSGGDKNRIWWVDAGSVLTLKSMVVTNGYLIGNNGGGMYNNKASVTINKCMFLWNDVYFDIDSRDASGGGIYNTGSMTITNSTFYGNRASGFFGGKYGGGIYNQGFLIITNSIFSGNGGGAEGGGVYNIGSSTINNCTFSGNRGYSKMGMVFGTGISNHGSMTITNSTLSGNIALSNRGGNGGGIYNGYFSTLTITNSTLLGNEASLFGGGIYNEDNGTVTIANSTLSGNLVYEKDGGGIYNQGILTITNSTLSGNSAWEYGGGIYNQGMLTITNSTLSGNSAILGGGIYNSEDSATTINSIIANNLTDFGCWGTITDGGYNISSDDTCGFDPSDGSMPNTDPLLGPLQDNGGPTLTHALAWNSPAIDTGDNDQCPTTDQRGVIRPLDGNGDGKVVCDIGAYEKIYQPLVLLPLVLK